MRFRRPSALITGLAIAVVSLVVAACGGSGSPSSTTSASNDFSHLPRAEQQRLQQDAVRFSDCMRSHGLTNYPDPNADPYAFKQALNSQSPAFRSAAPHCLYLLPVRSQTTDTAAQTHAHTVALLAFAHCLRGHGFPNFPDPSSSGQVTHQMIASAGIDLQQPAVTQAADACVSVTHGAITRGMVARFVAGH